MKVDSWSGLVTNASPFSLPVSAAVEQVNLAADIPGQIYSRGGMRAVASVTASGPLLDVLPYYDGGRTYLLVMDEAGALHLIESPAYGAVSARPQEPMLSAGSGSVATSYTYRYLDGRYGAAVDAEPPPPPDPEANYVVTIDGGTSATSSWLYRVNAMEQLPAGKWEAYDGGASATATTLSGIPVSALVAT